jgi:hypothetical protein
VPIMVRDFCVFIPHSMATKHEPFPL